MSTAMYIGDWFHLKVSVLRAGPGAAEAEAEAGAQEVVVTVTEDAPSMSPHCLRALNSLLQRMRRPTNARRTGVRAATPGAAGAEEEEGEEAEGEEDVEGEPEAAEGAEEEEEEEKEAGVAPGPIFHR